MPTDSSPSKESNGKRRVKNKAPKRLRRKNKPNDINTEENTANTESQPVEENVPSLPSKVDDNPPIIATADKILIEYWRNCTKKALAILDKQASNRRKFFIERHQERIYSIRYLLSQREQLDKLTVENQSISRLLDSLRNELRTKDETIRSLEDKLYDRNELVRDNDFLRLQLKSTEQKFDRFTMDYSKKLEEYRQHEHESNEQIRSLLDEIERIKRDLVLEEYRKQEAERKVRYYDDKMKIEQNLNKKFQQDIIQLKQELKSIHIRYDALQIEMLAMHKANNNDISLIPTKDTSDENEWTKKRSIDQESDEQVEIKRPKRKTRDRTESSESTTSNGSEGQLKKQDEPSLTVKRKTLKSKKTTKTDLPTLTVTEASPGVDSGLSSEKDPTQLSLPSTASTTSCTSNDTSSESQSSKPRFKKPSRYPCRRAQRPVKQIDTD